ncbi:MAG: bifunctional ornithine acetyltransferase/N-acetylglutamate synthase [Actinomycetota bacterium]|nr:bifunctional ornithine acetyltransferase/N-acetylglutamate synthase [Actinomycetota bacterium]
MREPLAPFEGRLPESTASATLPRGFRAGAATMGIKASGRTDVAIVAIEGGLPDASVAAVFTSNALVAAPLILSQRHLRSLSPVGDGRHGWSRGVVCTAGCANAATGAEGLADQERIAQGFARGLGTDPERTLAMSTGVIGARLPADRLGPEIARLAGQGLSNGFSALSAAAEAMCTTDSRPKSATVLLMLPDRAGRPVPVTVSGIAKGVGMIHPQMATMLAILLTDADVTPRILHGLLRPVAARTWDQLTVDGDTSTNDTVFLFASGAAGSAPLRGGSTEEGLLRDAVEAVARSLARQQAADGEGATTLLTCQVSGATDHAEARAVARAVVGSSLVKAAVHGRDPNWGRIAAAAGNARLASAGVLEAAGLDADEAQRRAGAPARLDPERLRIAICGQDVFDGIPLPFERAAVRALMDGPEVVVRVDLGLGDGRGEAFGCDLTEAYVIENSEYTT